eukprot:CAMPEP_0198141266 /NCGR_PEP_ID=MMETSP1443-20131203/4301_1 /TAXON_ID=186043 /ORGANISM="Entomoneis sp., Strain CCMP2396" /LENGTH=106 /DNA_ID=CAMNT_0043803969 /DNA_START=195 /DNA_END=515 /DNA_ORIENTATION=+
MEAESISSSSSGSGTTATAQKMTATTTATSSDRLVYATMQKGFETMVVQTGAGLILGGLAGIVLARGGKGLAARKAMVGLGAGIGLGSSWTRTSMDLETLLQQQPK